MKKNIEPKTMISGKKIEMDHYKCYFFAFENESTGLSSGIVKYKKFCYYSALFTLRGWFCEGNRLPKEDAPSNTQYSRRVLGTA